MDDRSAILYLIPYSPLAYELAKDPKNARWLRHVELEVDCGVSEREPSILQACDTGEGDDTVTREGTPAAGGDGNRERVALRLGFDDLVTGKGFDFGRDPDSDILLPNTDSISRHHFRIYFNLDSGVLMLEDTSTFGTSVGTIRLKRNSVALTDEAIHCGYRNSLGFLVQTQDYTGYEATYQNNLRSYISRVGSKSAMYLATPGANSGHRSLSKDYYILEEAVADGASGIVHTICRKNDGQLFAAKEIKCRMKKNRQPIVPSEVKILARISHVSRLIGRLEMYTANLVLARDCQVHRHGQNEVQGVCGNAIPGNG